MGAEPQHVGVGQGLLEQVPDLVKGGFLAVLAAAWRWAVVRRRRQRAAAELQAARDRYAQAGADAARLLVLHLFGAPDDRVSPDETLRRAAVIAHELQRAREALWQAQGHPDPELDPAGAEAARELIRELRRTHDRLRPVDDRPQDVLRPDDMEDSDR